MLQHRRAPRRADRQQWTSLCHRGGPHCVQKGTGRRWGGVGRRVFVLNICVYSLVLSAINNGVRVKQIQVQAWVSVCFRFSATIFYLRARVHTRARMWSDSCRTKRKGLALQHVPRTAVTLPTAPLLLLLIFSRATVRKNAP